MRESQLRARAVALTEQRFAGRPFDWRKSATCIHLMRFHAAQLGHSLPLVPRFRSALGARRALTQMGFETLPALLDSLFERIPAAFMRVGDVMALPGLDGFEALVIKGDRVKLLGWHDGAEDCRFMEVDVRAAVGAWRL